MKEAVILAGGFGTRLRSVVSDLPKPLAPVAGRPFLAYLLDALVRQGYSHAVLATGYMHEKVEACFGNDYGYEYIFARLLRGTAHKGDVLVGISTSGNSKNILEAYKVAQELGVHIVSMTGATGGKMRDCGGLLLNVPSTDTPRIQESHIMLGHIICELVETAMFK